MEKGKKGRFISLQVQITFWAGLCLLLSGIIIIIYATLVARQNGLALARAEIEGHARTQASVLDADLEVAMDAARTLAQSLAAQRSAAAPANLSRDQVNAMLRNVMETNPNFLGVSTAWEPDAFDGKDQEFANTPGYDQTGRLVPYWARAGNKVVYSPLVDYETEGAGEYYLCSKRSGKECIIDPYVYKIEGKDVLMTSLIAPIVVDGKFVGMAGVDMAVDYLQEKADRIDLFDKQGRMVIISNNGTIVGETGTPEHVGKQLKDFQDDYLEDLAIIQDGKEQYSDQGDVLELFSPVAVGNTVTPWSVLVMAPQSVVTANVNTEMFTLIGLSAAMILLGLVGIWFVVRRTVVAPILLIRQGAILLSQGDAGVTGIDRKDIARINARNDEMGEIGRAFNDLIAYLTDMASVAASIAGGNLSSQVQPRSTQDVLGQAFAQMTTTLRQSITRVSENAQSLKAASTELAQAAVQAGTATNQIAATVQQVAKGLAQESGSISQTAASVEQMGRAIIGVARGAQEQADGVSQTASAMSKLTTTVEGIRQGARLQAEQMEQAARAQSDMVMAVANASNAADQVAQETEKTAASAADGTAIAARTVGGMQRLQSTTEELGLRVRDLGKRSGQIGAIIETIDDIAAQTNLLALNAAIEAARAGEHGRGFAVVADEVRKLAERSSQATKEIGEMIRTVQGGANETVEAMRRAGEDVSAAVDLVNKAGSSFDTIARGTQVSRQRVDAINEAVRRIQEAASTLENSIKQAASIAERNRQASEEMNKLSNEAVERLDSVSAVVEENTAATEEMAASSSEVNQAVENIASVAEENSAAVEEVSASAEEMSAQVEEVSASAQSLAELARVLDDVVGHFKLA